MILAGDRNIGDCGSGNLGIAATITNASTSGSSQSKWGTDAATTPAWAWDQASLHLKNGTLGLADGSVQQTTIAGLQQAFCSATNNEPNPNPCYNFPQ
jgi:hypothetical protein